jgi:transcription initiation factor TFIIH subunit 2
MPPTTAGRAGDASDDEEDAVRSSSRRRTNRGDPSEKARDFEVTRTWDALQEGEDGTLTGSILELESLKRRRLIKDTTPLQRGIIRHVVLIVDMSLAMAEKDLRPTRYLLTITYLTQFINEFFEQNPISQLGIVGMHDGIAIRISDLSGNPAEHLTAVAKMRPTYEPKGNPSLENALEMARAALFHAPQHGTREILLIFGALHTSDPGDIHITIANLTTAHIRASVIGLAAQVAICAELVSKTNNKSTSNYHVVKDEQHYRELVLGFTTPPVTYTTPASAKTPSGTSGSSLLMMGFPSRTVSTKPTLCACHTKPSYSGYLCSRCSTKVCSLPSECPVCGLTLILSTHLARSYHHLFPLHNWLEVPWIEAWKSSACYSCQRPFPDKKQAVQAAEQSKSKDLTSGRYACPTCHRHFCIDCDLFAHEVVHNCPGCQSMRMETALMGEVELGVDQTDQRENGDHRMEGVEASVQGLPSPLMVKILD